MFIHLILFTMQTLRILVYLNDMSKQADKPVFERILSLVDCVAIDYSRTLETLRFLFGEKCVVVFENSL